MGKYFGTDGFRGEANKDLTVEHAFKVGRYLGYYYGKKNPEGRAKVVIGKDTRRSSYMFEYALVAGLTASGADAYLMHVTPTPSVSYIVRSDNFDCGIMISASHNPYYDNGIKVINGMGYKLEAAVEEEIEAYIDGEIGEIPLATRDNIGKTVDYTMGRNRYIGYLMTIPTRPFKNMRVGLDTANGASYLIAKSVFDALGAKTYIINNDPDGFNINSCRHLSRRITWMWDLPMTEMQTGVFVWMTRARSLTEIRYSMCVAVISRIRVSLTITQLLLR